MPDHPTEQVDRAADAILRTMAELFDSVSINKATAICLARAALDAATPPPDDSVFRSGGQTKQFGPRPRIATTPPVGSVGERDQPPEVVVVSRHPDTSWLFAPEDDRVPCPTCGHSIDPVQRWCPQCLKWVVGERDQ